MSRELDDYTQTVLLFTEMISKNPEALSPEQWRAFDQQIKAVEDEEDVCNIINSYADENPAVAEALEKMKAKIAEIVAATREQLTGDDATTVAKEDTQPSSEGTRVPGDGTKTPAITFQVARQRLLNAIHESALPSKPETPKS